MGTMKKLLPLCLLSAIMASSCSIILEGVEEFGDASIIYDLGGMFDDTTILKVGEKKYVDAGTMASGVKKGEYIAAINGRDHYSYRFYTIDGEEELLIVNFYSLINIVNAYRIYASEDALSIPSYLLDDFPHHDDFFDGGKEITIGGVSYSFYGTFEKGLEVGEELYVENGVPFYELIDHPLWLARKNAYRDYLYDLCYRNDSIESLDADIVWAVTMQGRE